MKTTKTTTTDALKRVMAVLPSYWHALIHVDGYILVTECDQPTFRVYPDRVEWATTIEAIKADWPAGEDDLFSLWHGEALCVHSALVSTLDA